MAYRDYTYYLDFSDAKRAAASRARKYEVPVSVTRGFQMTGLETVVTTCFEEGGCQTEYSGEKVPAWLVSWTPPEYVDPNDLLSMGLLEVPPDNLSIAERQEKFERQKEAERQEAERAYEAEIQAEAKRQKETEQDRITIQNQCNKVLPAEWGGDRPAPMTKRLKPKFKRIECWIDGHSSAIAKAKSIETLYRTSVEVKHDKGSSRILRFAVPEYVYSYFESFLGGASLWRVPLDAVIGLTPSQIKTLRDDWELNLIPGLEEQEWAEFTGKDKELDLSDFYDETAERKEKIREYLEREQERFALSEDSGWFYQDDEEDGS